MINWNDMVIGLSVLLLLFLCIAEIKRVNKARLAGRLLASVLAVAGLALMALPVSVRKKIHEENNKPAVLLTEGYDKDSIDNFIKKSKENIRVYAVDSLASIDTNITTLHIFGNGLALHQMKLLNKMALVFHPSQINSGITSVHWKQNLAAGEKLLVQGTFSNILSTSVKIALVGFGTTMDSVIIPPKKTNAFELGTIPKHIGKALYSLLVTNRGDEVEKEPIPINVERADTFKILLLSASPDFEHKFLKNWLAENGYAVAARTRISKEKYDKTFLNIAVFPFERITGSLLSRFEILVSDASELATLSGSELSAIHAQVRNGMGLVVSADTILKPAAFYAAHFTQYFSSAKQLSSSHSPLFLRDLANPLPPLPGGQNAYLRNYPGNQPLVLNSFANAVVSSSMEGLGKIVFSTISNTYAWMLAGNQQDYFLFWSSILQKAVRSTGTKHNTLISGIFPTVNEPVELYFENPDANLPGISIDSSRLSLQQNPTLPFQWMGTFWPLQQGWQTTFDFAEDRSPWYVFDKNDWRNIAAIDKIRQTTQYIKNKTNTGKNNSAVQQYTSTNLPGYYFLLIFITSCCFLWIEKKLSVS